MTASQDMIRGRSNIVTMTNNSGGALIAGDVCIQDTTGDEYVTTTTSAASTIKVFVAAESIASGATGKFYESGYCPLVNVSASATRGYFLFTHTVAKQATSSTTYAAGAFGRVLKAGTTPSAIIYSATAQTSGGGVARSGSTTNNHLVVWDGSNADSIKDGGAPSSGGNVTYESAYASPPTPASGDVWFISDSQLHARYNESAWQYYHGTKQVTKPVLSSFSTWFNQGSATLTDVGELILWAPAGTGDNVRGKVLTAPALPYTIDAIVIPGNIGTNYMDCGICLSNGTAFVTFGIGTVNSANVSLSVTKWTNSGAYSAAYTSLAAVPFYASSRPLYLRMVEDVTNRTCSFSLDQGNHWQQFHQIGRTDFMTATQVGIFVYHNNATYAPTMSLLSWKQS